MWRSNTKRDLIAWTALCCFLAFGCGVVLVKRFRPAGPVEFQELPATSVPVPAPTPLPAPSRRPTPETEPPAATSPPATITTRPQIEPQQVSPKPKAASSVRGKSKAEPEAQSISLNSGDLTELEKLPGIGPGIAQRIIDYRTEHGPFQTIDELRDVKGIGEKRLAKILPFVRL